MLDLRNVIFLLPTYFLRTLKTQGGGEELKGQSLEDGEGESWSPKQPVPKQARKWELFLKVNSQ